MTPEQEIATQPAVPEAGMALDAGSPAADGSDLTAALPVPTRTRSTKRRARASGTGEPQAGSSVEPPAGAPVPAPGTGSPAEDVPAAPPAAARPAGPVAGTGDRPAEDPPDGDPLAKITLAPRTFGAVLAVVGLLLGLVLALVPVHVAGMDTDQVTSVSCGNTIGGVETPLIAQDLGPISDFDNAITAAYVGTCEQAIGTRLLFAWPMFFAGMLGILWLGVVRRTGAYSTVQ